MENTSYHASSSQNQELVFRGSKLVLINQNQKRKPMFDQRGSLQNGIKLSFEKGFGFIQKEQLRSAQCLDDNKMLYILGKQILLYDMLTQNQRVMDNFGEEQQVTSFKYYKNMMLDDNILYALHSNNKLYPSLVNKNISKNTQHKYILSHLEKEEQVMFVDIVNDYKHICIVSELENNFRLSFIQIASKEVYCSESIYFMVKGMIVPFLNDKIVLLYNDKQIYGVEVAQEVKSVSFKLTHKLDQEQKIVEAITSTQNIPLIYMITNKGNLYNIWLNLKQTKIQKTQKIFLGTYQTMTSTGELIQQHKQPSSICCNQYNILIGYYHIEEFTLIKVCALNNATSIEPIKFSCPYLHKIIKMTFAQETMAVCVLVQVKEGDKYDLSIPIQSEYLKEKGEIKMISQNPQHHLLPPGKIFPVVLNLLLHDTLVETLRSPVQSVLTSTLMVQKIIDICLIPTRKLFLVLSAEKRIKAIKYEHISSTSFERMLAWQCIFNQNDHPTSLDAHPLTNNVAVGFRQGLKLFIICSQGLKSTNIQFPLKNCQTVRYSRYGHKLIAGSLNQLIVINPYDNQVINTIQFGSSYMLKELTFLDKDRFIQGIFANGSTMVMSSEGHKLFEVWNKNNKCLCSAFDSVFDITAVSYPDSITKFYRERGTQQFAVMWTYPFNITKFLIVNQIGTIFMGTSLGKIRAHQWPFTDSMKFTKHYTQIQLHSSPITNLQISHDYSLLISGAEDGSVFISRINAISEGIQVNDAEVLSSFKSSYKNYKTLYYLQNYLNSSNSLDSQQQETIIQLESDKSDFQTQYADIIHCIQNQIEEKIKFEENKKSQALKEELAPLENQIDQFNNAKLSVREEITSLIKAKSDNMFALEEQKLTKIRELYKETDMLKEKKQHYETIYSKQIAEAKEKYEKTLQILKNDCSDKSQRLNIESQQMKDECHNTIIRNKAFLAEQQEQGIIFKTRMMDEMQGEFNGAREEGEYLRKQYNKLLHDNSNYEQKMKYFQQLKSELEIDLENAREKKEKYNEKKKQLTKLLKEKDLLINNQEQLLKKLVSDNINNYTHQEYLKHKKEELLDKAKYLQGEMGELDKKYVNFQEDFTATKKQSKEIDKKVMEALETIKKLKQEQKEKEQMSFMKKYKKEEIHKLINQTFRKPNPLEPTRQILVKIFELIEDHIEQTSQETPNDVNVAKRDHLIKQVVNANNLRKIDDNIRRTIMVKLNRETVTLTCEVNELRKQKKTLSIKLKNLINSIKEIKETQAFKQNNSMQDLITANISMIRKTNSKHTSSQKLLPFQLYHNTKSITRSHIKHASKDLEESSTQLPSLLKHSMSGGDSGLEGVEQTDDDLIL